MNGDESESMVVKVSGLGGARAPGEWMLDELAVPRHGGRITRTSMGDGDWNYWEMSQQEVTGSARSLRTLIELEDAVLTVLQEADTAGLLRVTIERQTLILPRHQWPVFRVHEGMSKQPR